MSDEGNKIKIRIKKDTGHQKKASLKKDSFVTSTEGVKQETLVDHVETSLEYMSKPVAEKVSEQATSAVHIFEERKSMMAEKKTGFMVDRLKKEIRKITEKIKIITARMVEVWVKTAASLKVRVALRKKGKGTEKKRQTKKEKVKKPFFFRGFSIKELVHFAKRLAFLTRSGVPVLESLQIVRKQTRSRLRGKMLETVIEDVANGRPLSLGLGRFRESFGDFAISVVRVGEMSGTLSSNLSYLAEELQKRHVLRRKVISALVYPAFITVATIGVTVLLTVYIFPKVMPIFTSLNVVLPFTTKVLLLVSNFLREYGLYTLGALVVAFIVGSIVIRKSIALHHFLDRITLRLPLFGNLVRNYNMTNFCRTLSLLLRSGFNIVEAMTVTSESTPNLVYKKEVLELRERIVKGDRLSTYLEERSEIFPDIVTHMVMIGEASGTLSDIFMYLAEHYEAEVDDTVKNLSNSIEPALMIFMGLLVGFVAVSVITPIYEVTQNLSR